MPFIIPANTLATGGFDVDNSCRFNDGSPDILKNGTESDGNRKVWTISMWIKRSKLGVRQSLWSWGSNSSSTGELYIDANDFLVLNNDGHQGSSNEVAGVLRDISAWYHIVWRCDVTESNNIDRWRCYINGVQRLLTDAASVSNADGEINKNGTHQNWIGGAARSLQSGNAVYPFGGYIAEAVFIDGQALAPTSFGEFDEDSGIWKPIDVSGLTFGDEGVYLNFQNASELGTDVSGNGNTYAETGLTAVDQSTDTCTNNFMTLNPLIGTGTYTDNQVYSEGNTIVIPNSTDNYGTAFGTFGATRGKWYWEAQIIWNGTSNNANYPKQIGFMREDYAFNKSYLGQNDDQTWGVAFHDLSTDGWGLDHNGSFGAITGATTLADDKMLMFALDLDNGKFYMGYDGTFFTSGDPTSGATGTGAIATLDATDLSFTIIPAVTNATDTTHYKMNFGNPAYAIASSNADGDGFGNFEFAVPNNYFSWCTKNLAEYG